MNRFSTEKSQANMMPAGYAESVFLSVPNGLVVLSADLSVLSVNQSFLQRFDVDEAMIRNRRFFDVMVAEGLADKIAQVRSSERPQADVMLEMGIKSRSSRLLVRVSITNVVLPDQGGVLLTMDEVPGYDRAQTHIKYLTNCDPLTGLVNRAWFLDRLNQELISANAHGDRVALLLVDLNRFREIKNSAGQATGDRILAEVARRLRGMLRSEDIVARLGAGTFVIMASVSDQVAAGIAQRVCEALSMPISIGAHSVVLGANVGIASFPEDGCSPQDLLENAADAAERICADGGGFRCYRQEVDHYPVRPAPQEASNCVSVG